MADVPAHEMSREVANRLMVARDSGETVSLQQLREEFGLGFDDMRSILEQLRVEGMAQEVAPGEWQGDDGDSLLDEAGGEEREIPRVSVRPSDPEPPAPLSEMLTPSWVPPQANVRLTRAIVEAMGDEGLGQLVKAGLTDTGEDEVFMLEVAP